MFDFGNEQVGFANLVGLICETQRKTTTILARANAMRGRKKGKTVRSNRYEVYNLNVEDGGHVERVEIIIII